MGPGKLTGVNSETVAELTFPMQAYLLAYRRVTAICLQSETHYALVADWYFVVKVF